MSTATLVELVGYLGSALIVASLTMRSILRLRLIGLAGALAFLLYGVLIRAWPIVVTNVVIVGIQVHFLRGLLGAKEYFRILEVRRDSRYLEYFLDVHGREIRHIWPGFAYAPCEGQLTLFILRDLVPAGLFIGEALDEKTLKLRLDFVIPGYRDLKVGRYLYARGALRERGFEVVVAEAGSDETAAYLEKVGFRRDAEPGRPRRYVRRLDRGAPGGGSLS
ncbi:MAG: hypothetical protein ACE5HF_08460 [Gemmatimonadota bacterium]